MTAPAEMDADQSTPRDDPAIDRAPADAGESVDPSPGPDAEVQASGPDAEGQSSPTRCGFVALVGAPNAGKSTLINTLVGAKVAIVSPKVQTTRTRVLGIATFGDETAGDQLIFVDTPGIFAPRRRLDRAMVAAAWQGAEDADEIVVLVDAARRSLGADTLGIVERLTEQDRTAVLALNKVDTAPKARLLEFAGRLNETGRFRQIFMISALTGDGVEDLRDHLRERLQPGPWLFPEDQLSDMPMRLLAAEITREKLFTHLHKELPYAITVETEEWEPFEDGSLRIGQVIFVERDSQRAIVLGAGGSMIKTIGQESRTELTDILEQTVHLKLFVKVREHWSEDPERFSAIGLDWG